MKIKFITTWWPEVTEKIQHEVELSKYIGIKDVSHVFDASSDVFYRFLQTTKGTRGCTLNPIIELNASEIELARYFQLQARGNILQETHNDENFNNEEIEKTPLLLTDAKTNICLVQKVYLSNPKVRPYMISAMHRFGMYVLHESVIDVFKSAGLTGFSIKSVVSTKTNAEYQNCGLLFSNSILSKAENDISMYKRGACFSRLGCLTYDENRLNSALDFNRTSENFDTFNFPDWVVSKRVKMCCEKHKIKGWHFQPVLEKGSIIHKAYLEKWETLFLRLKQYDNIKILGF